MTPPAPWSPTAHAFAQHQFSHVANFWKQSLQASFQLEALPDGQAELNLTFKLPSASQVIPPPSHVPQVPAPHRPIQPLFPKGCFPQGFGVDSKLASQKKTPSRQRKSYWRSVLHKAAMAAPSLPPPKNGSLRQAALASVQRLRAVSASPINIHCAKKRPCSDFPSAESPQNLPPLAQRIRSEIQIDESEPEPPEREKLRSSPCPEKSPPPISPFAKDFPLPTPLVFTPVKPNCFNCDAEMTVDHQCEEREVHVDVEAVEEQLPPLPLCHYCCHWGSGEEPVHYYLQCLCADWPCTCWCYCSEAQLEHKKLVFPAGFGLPGYKMKTVSTPDRPKARELAESRTGKAKPCDNPSCMRDFEEDNAKALQKL